MCTAVFGAIKEVNKDCRITFSTRYPEIFNGHPNLDEVVPFDRASLGKAVELGYDRVLPPARPLAVLMAECVGLRTSRRNVELPHLRAQLVRPPLLDQLPGPIIVVQPLASRWTPNKEWPAAHWIELIQLLLREFSVVEVGHRSLAAGRIHSPRFASVCESTSLLEFLSFISHADVFAGPPSGGMHVANGFEIPSVILFGGYESPKGYGYANVTPFYTSVPCAPCWLVDACPYSLKCLHAISPDAVAEAIRKAAFSAPVPH
jgi:ADP-heptose:LPS heptosyltransferase